MALSDADTAAIQSAARSSGVPASLLSAIALQESGGNPNARNTGSGAAGLFQVLPSTGIDPGYGVAPLVNAYDPTASATFAGSYLAALYQQTGSWDAAVSKYSGGGYSLSTLQSKFPNAFADGSMSGTSAGGIGGLAGGTSLGDIMHLGLPGGGTASPNTTVTNAINGGSGGGGGLINGIWEIVSRGLLLIVGFVLVIIALLALLWQSKTVRTSAAHFGGAIAA